MTRIVIAPDSFKESLISPQVAAAIASGIARVLPQADLILTPMADGGEGLAECLYAALGGTRRSALVSGPMGETVTAEWLALDNGMAVIEMAAASGLGLVPPDQRNPVLATSYGTGQLIRQALDAGYHRLIVGVGGSATSDGGIGMARALGVKFLDKAGHELPSSVDALLNLHTIDMSQVHPALSSTSITAACDVSNPLCGPLGAAHVYGPQKGASPEQVDLLDAAMARLADVVSRDLGLDLANYPGAGGGGGLGYGLLAFTGASIVSGLDLVCELTGFDKILAEDIDLVITGEGQLNEQSLFGKVPAGIAARAKKHHIPVLALVGSIALPAATAAEHGIDAVVSIAPGPISLADSMAKAPQLLADAAERALRLIMLKVN